MQSYKRTPYLPLLCCLLSLVTTGISRAALSDFDFQAQHNAQGWRSANDTANATFTRDGLRFTITGKDPYLLGPRVNLSSQEPICAHIRLHSSTGGRAQLFYYQKNSREEDSVWFDCRTNTWTEVRLPLPPLGADTQLRLDPPGQSGTCTISYLRIEPATGIGVTAVSASATELSITVKTGSPLQIVELPPNATYTDADKAPVILSANQSQTFKLPRFDGSRDRLYSAFLALNARHETVGPLRFVSGFHDISKYPATYPQSTSKKGLQVQMVDDAIALGIKHAALNVSLTPLIDVKQRPDSYPWQMDGRTYYFNKGYVDHLPVKQLTDAGINVAFIMLAHQTGDAEKNRLLIHPWASDKAPNHLAAFNTLTAEGVQQFKACMEFLADRFSRPDGQFGRVWGYIIGNEVNSHWHWYNLGAARQSIVAQEYEKAVRIADTAVRKSSPVARVYLSLEHHWNISYEKSYVRTCTGRGLVDEFNRYATMAGNFDWNIAFHPYPENLMNPRTWEDKSATFNENTPRITFRNLEILPRYLSRPELLINGHPRHIILSEQGFNSGGRPDGELLQAAAYCYAYRKVASLAAIDAFIYHRHVDHTQEGGALFGLWRNKPGSISTPDTKKPIYDVFKAADTDHWQDAFRFALPIIGIQSWDEINGK